MNKKKINIIVGVAIVALIGVFAATKLGNKDNEGEKGETIKIIHTAGETEVPKNPEKVVVRLCIFRYYGFIRYKRISGITKEESANLSFRI